MRLKIKDAVLVPVSQGTKVMKVTEYVFTVLTGRFWQKLWLSC